MERTGESGSIPTNYIEPAPGESEAEKAAAAAAEKKAAAKIKGAAEEQRKLEDDAAKVAAAEPEPEPESEAKTAAGTESSVYKAVYDYEAVRPPSAVAAPSRKCTRALMRTRTRLWQHPTRRPRGRRDRPADNRGCWD